MSAFIGRETELKRLHEAAAKKTASFIIVKGRRRIGKSRLIKEFGKSFDHFYAFTGLPPTKGVTIQHQMDEFSRQMAEAFHLPVAHYQDWGDIFWAVAERVKQSKVLLLFDEISWMGSKDPTFLGKIKNAWDLHFKENDNLIFVVCGSASSWIEKNIMGSTGFVGRISFTLTLKELPIADCKHFWPKNISAYEKFKCLSVVGGIPKYLEEMNAKKSAEENIKKLCFTSGGLLVDEFNQIFSDIFLRDSDIYKRILEALSNGAKEKKVIQAALQMQTAGRLSEYLWELELAGFIDRDYTWNLMSGEESKLSRYRLQDNYLRFYLKYIQKNRGKIERGNFILTSLGSLPAWHVMMGLQFENLILNNRKDIHRLLGIKPGDIVCENPYFQQRTTKHLGCQVDYLIQTKFDTLYVCEIKFSKHEIGTSIIDEMQSKLEALQCHRRFSCRPVLIHVNGVADSVVESDFFAEIIEASRLFD